MGASEIVGVVNKFVKQRYDNDEYNWIHNEFVTKYALILSKKLGADLEVLEISARFHDIDYSRGSKFHAQDSAKFAEEFLRKQNYPAKKIEIVKQTILCHTSSIVKTIKAPHLEGKILFDADKMWNTTPAGFARLIAHRYRENTSYSFILKELKKRLEWFNKLHFNESRVLIKTDFEICKKFVGRFAS